MMEQRATTIEEIKKYTEGRLVRLPDFSDGQPFQAKLKRPSMLALVKEGKIPNTLLMTANKLFAGRLDIAEEGSDTLDQVFRVLDVMCEAAMVEPSYKEIKEAGITLTDEQYMAIFNYTQEGVKALEPFRGK